MAMRKMIFEKLLPDEKAMRRAIKKGKFKVKNGFCNQLYSIGLLLIHDREQHFYPGAGSLPAGHFSQIGYFDKVFTGAFLNLVQQ